MAWFKRKKSEARRHEAAEARERQLADAMRSLQIQRAFAAAAMTNLLANWTQETKRLDADLKAGLKSLRARSREASQNNDYARKYLQMLKTNVIGPQGIRLQCRAKNAAGKLDQDANRRVEEAWDRHGRRGQFDVTGKLSRVDGQNLFIETAARDGEALVRKVPGFDNDFRFAVQFLDVDLLDEKHNATLKNGEIRMGVELDKWERPVAYHLLAPGPGEDTYFSGGQYRVRIPADQIIHAFRAERPHQTRGFPWTASALIHLHHIGGFEEAAIIAARLGASTMGFYTEETPGGLSGDDTAASGDLIHEAEPGVFRKLPKGVRFEKFDPGYPSEIVDPFLKRSLKGVASGLNVGYNALASDPEGTTYGTLRAFSIEERDHSRTLQGWTSEVLLDGIYPDWLRQALLTRQIDLPASRYEKLLAACWQPRGWQWIDPAKDMLAVKTALEHNIKAPSMIAAEQGLDFEDVVRQIAADREILARYGLQKKEQENAEV